MSVRAVTGQCYPAVTPRQVRTKHHTSASASDRGHRGFPAPPCPASVSSSRNPAYGRSRTCSATERRWVTAPNDQRPEVRARDGYEPPLRSCTKWSPVQPAAVVLDVFVQPWAVKVDGDPGEFHGSVDEGTVAPSPPLRRRAGSAARQWGSQADRGWTSATRPTFSAKVPMMSSSSLAANSARDGSPLGPRSSGS